MIEQLFWFSVTVFPLVIIPGPDMILCIAQGLSHGKLGVWRSVNGITLGYLAHAVLSAVGLATLIAASSTLFEIVRWTGIAYLTWLSLNMLHSAISPVYQKSSRSYPNTSSSQTANKTKAASSSPISLWRGFLTSFLNPKGLFVYLSIVPQFINPDGNVGTQALALSVMNAALCYIVYSTVGLIAARSSRIGRASPLHMQITEGIGGTLLGVITLILATN